MLRGGWRLFVLALGCAVLSIALLAPAAAQQGPDDEDKQEITVWRGGKLHKTKVLKEAPDPENGQPSRPGAFIVTFRDGVDTAAREKVHAETGADLKEKSRLREADVVRVKPGEQKKAMDAYRARAEVLSVEPDLIVRAVGSPNDTRFGEQWGMAKINAPAAWDTTTGSASVRVAVLDCGVFAPETSSINASDGEKGHPDLRNGKVVASANFSTSLNHDDFCNHGTHVAGIAAANTNNAAGVAGIGYDTRIVSVKVLGDNGSGSFTSIINGIYWAANCPASGGACGPRRAEVINMSLGAGGTCSSSLQTAINKAWAQGLVIVAAAGNSNTSSTFTPAVCANTIAVSSSTSTDARSSFSNYGSWVDVAAPGSSILSTDYVGGYSLFNGTSMASPHVAGLAALVWNTSHNTGNAAVVARILSTANTGALAGSVNGRIDAAAAVADAVPPAPPEPDLIPPTVTIEQAVGQVDPTPVSPVNFTVVFSEPVTGFDSSDVVLSGGAGATTAVVTGSGTTYNVAVNGMAVTGTVTATVAAGGAIDAGNNGNEPSVSIDNTVSYTVPAAPVCSATVTSTADTSPSGGGTVTISVSLGSAVTEWRTQRRSSGTWYTRATLSKSTATWSGSDSSSDPLWRIGWKCNGVWTYGASFDP